MSGRSVYRLFLLLVAVIVGVTTFHYVPPPLPELSRAEFLAEVHAGHVRSVVIEDREVILGTSSARGEFSHRLSRSRGRCVAR